MKKGLIAAMLAGGFFAFTTIGCGEKYTPLTQEQITAKADSVATARSAEAVAAVKADCEANLAQKVADKVTELQATASAEVPAQ
jgi:hypothetical protein